MTKSISNSGVGAQSTAGQFSAVQQAANLASGALSTSHISNIWAGSAINSIYSSSYISNIKSVSPNLISISRPDGSEIVHIDENGKVVWKDGINIDAAADAISRSLYVGAERAAKITNNVKQRIRDTVFEEMIYIAKNRGSLSVDELTLMWESAKIMDKLKGGYDE